MSPQPSLRRMRSFAVRPDRELGQNFLVDSNILGVIERAAELRDTDVVLEVGGGLGVLSEHLAERVAHLHVVELDERLREALLDAVGARANVSLHWGDALRLPLARLLPPPGKLVANLPYGIAATLLLRSVVELPDVALWVAMTQREVAERLAAAPSSPAYGAPSVLAQLDCTVELLRTIPRSVFSPVPNVDSSLLRMRRRGRGAHAEQVRVLVRASFAHRRKTLAGSLELAGGQLLGGRGGRARARAALEAIGERPDVRAERLSPERFLELARALGIQTEAPA